MMLNHDQEVTLEEPGEIIGEIINQYNLSRTKSNKKPDFSSKTIYDVSFIGNPTD